MAVFGPKSRYRSATLVTAADRRGRSVVALTPVIPPAERLLGEHLRREGQRPDHLAARYLDDPEGYWRIAELNDAMSPDVLAQAVSVKIPARR
jgi:hypothetical protein